MPNACPRRQSGPSLLPLAAVAAALIAGAAQAGPVPSRAAVAKAAALAANEQLELARALVQAGQDGAALDAYSRALTAGVRDPAARLEYARVLERNGQWADAARAWLDIDGERDAYEARLGAMRCAIRLNQPAVALQQAEAALRRRPRETAALVGRGVALDGLGRHAEAQASYRAALARDPGDLPARNNLALSLALSGQYDEAAQRLGDLAASADATPQVRQNLALVYGLKGDRAAATRVGAEDLPPQVAAANAEFLAQVSRAGSKPSR